MLYEVITNRVSVASVCTNQGIQGIRGFCFVITSYSIHYTKLYELMAHRFPGNIRELENIIERAVILSRGRLVTAADLPEFEDQLPDNDGTGGELIPKDSYNFV